MTRIFEKSRWVVKSGWLPGESNGVHIWSVGGYVRSIQRLLIFMGVWGLAALTAVLPRAPAAIAAEPSAQDAAQPPDPGTDIRDPSLAPATSNELRPGLFYGGKAEFEIRSERNVNIDTSRPNDRTRVKPKFELALRYKPNSHFSAFGLVQVEREEWLQNEANTETDRTRLKIEEAYIALSGILPGLTLNIGRHRIKDERNWIFQKRNDAIQLYYEDDVNTARFAVSTEQLLPKDLLGDRNRDRIVNYILFAERKLTKAIKIAGYGVFRDNRDKAGQQPLFLGLRAIGQALDGLDYWADLSHMRGTDPDGNGGKVRNRGFGFDVGATWHFRAPVKTYLTFSYAFGSGDGDSGDNTNNAFRQTGIGGLAQNRGRWGGTTFFNYYGDIFVPDLNNVSVLTFGAGFRPWPRSSVDLVYHHYRQDKAVGSTSFLVDPDFSRGIEAVPNGVNRELGDEIDLIAGYKEIQGLEVELLFAYFTPGRAFGRGADDSYQAKFKVRYLF